MSKSKNELQAESPENYSSNREFYSVSEFSEITGLSTRHIRKLIYDKQIACLNLNMNLATKSKFLIPGTEIVRLREDAADNICSHNPYIFQVTGNSKNLQ